MSKLKVAHPGRRPERNWFLSHLPKADYTTFAPQLEALEVKSGDLLYAPGHHMEEVYFPAGAIISLVCCPTADSAMEVAVIGEEGFVGQPIPRAWPTTVARVVVQLDGAVFRARRDSMRRLLEASPAARELAARARQGLLDQVMLCAACNVGHSPFERCARWFLMIHDRVPGDDFLVKQEFLAYMLGMARQTVSGVASQLQEHGSIEYSRGHVRITDRERLEALACPCYGMIQRRLHQLLASRGAATGGAT
jgi:Crp-like helix-turn-helix protein